MVHWGGATLDIGSTEYEELEPLKPVSVGNGYVFSLAFSVTGGKVEPVGTGAGASRDAAR
jgi:hypothetical protein